MDWWFMDLFEITLFITKNRLIDSTKMLYPKLSMLNGFNLNNTPEKIKYPITLNIK